MANESWLYLQKTSLQGYCKLIRPTFLFEGLYPNHRTALTGRRAASPHFTTRTHVFVLDLG